MRPVPIAEQYLKQGLTYRDEAQTWWQPANTVCSGSSRELLSECGAEHSGPAIGKVESAEGGNRMRTTLSDCDGRLVSASSSKSAIEQAAYSLDATCMSSGDISPHTDNSIPISVDINEASRVSPKTKLVTTSSGVCAMNLSAPNAEHKDVLCESSDCCDETLASSGGAEVCASSTTIRHLSPADKGKLHEASASQCKGPNSAASSIEDPGGDAASDLKIPTLSICVS